MASKTTTATSSGKLNSDSLAYNKYGGMVRRSLYKRLRTDIVQLFNYVYTVSPYFQVVHIIVTIFRVLQIIGPSLMEASHFWTIDDISKMTVSVISVFYHLLPPSVRGTGGTIVCYVYIVFSLVFLIFILCSALYFKKNAKLPALIPAIISLYFATFNLLAPPIALNFTCEFLSMIFFHEGYKYTITDAIIIPVGCVIVFVIFAWLYLMIASNSLAFRPTSFMTTMIGPQNLVYLLTNIVNLLLGFTSNSSKISQIVCLVVAILLYGWISYLPFYSGGFVNKTIGAIISAAGISSCIMCLIHMVISLMNVRIGLPLIFVLVLLFIILIITMKIVINLVSSRHFIVLDHFNDQNDVNIFKSVNHIINCACDGFIIAHPACVSRNIFIESVTRWPGNVKVWYIFAKFCAIYPEDSTTLTWIYHSVVAARLKGPTARAIKEQTLSISRQRESNLSPNLKTKLGSVQKKTLSAKQKLRHIWDLAIQGSIGEMEPSIKKFYNELEKADAEFKHLIRQYPNNRFVTRGYARFCKEIKAEYKEYFDCIEKSRSLQRGQIVTKDSISVLGMLAYPNLPKKLTQNVDSQSVNANSGDLNQSSFDLTETDEEALQDDATSMNTLKDSINVVKIPSIICTKVSRIIMLIIVFVIPMIALFAYSSIFIKELTDPLQYVYQIALMNSKTVMLNVFNLHYFYESIGIYNKTIHQAKPPVLFGGSYDTGSMLTYIISEAITSAQNVYSFRSYKSPDDNIKRAQDLIFGSALKYSYFNSPTENTTVYQTIQAGIMDMAAQASTLLKENPVNPEDVNTSIILNPMYNMEVIDQTVTDSLTSMNQYFLDNDATTKQISLIVLIVGILLCVFAFTIELIIQLVWIQSNKEEAYHCLTALPKPTVSALVENLRILKNEDGNESTTNSDSEISKQEDNIMKTLVTGGDATGSKLADRILIIIGTLVTIILEVVSFYLFYDLFTYESYRLIVSAPHLNYLTTEYSQAIVSHSILQLLALDFRDSVYKYQLAPREELEKRFLARIKKIREYYRLSRFGGPNDDQVPFLGFAKGIEAANKYIDCPDPEAMPKDFMAMAACTSVENLFIMLDVLVYYTYIDEKVHINPLDPKAGYFDWVWTLLISPVYDGLFGPMFETIIPTIDSELAARKGTQYPILIVLLIITILFECIVIFQVYNIDKHIRSVLRLLLHCPHSVVMSTPKIMTVMNGDFSKMKGDVTKRDHEFYDKVFQLLPDAILVCDAMSYNILSISKATTRILMKEEEELIDSNIKDLFSSDQFKGDSSKLFSSNNQIDIPMELKDSEGSIVNLEISVLKINSQLVFFIRDVTSRVRYNTLIKDEKKKSDTLLQSILPPSLVERVQAGEKNISFAVQSATIIFMDIVSFTPWCGSNEANKVMMTLNLLFKKLDWLIAKYHTMTKIKCIGDCYMAAGGIFSENNVPAEHAKEVVSFGVDALGAVKELDEELDERLQIRVGINTGGPIVAGVLGIGKPTFEILGPAINMAQQMEHHGLPMAVHISRPVYELIYGDSFRIKERGTVEVKNGTVITYIVEDKLQN